MRKTRAAGYQTPRTSAEPRVSDAIVAADSMAKRRLAGTDVLTSQMVSIAEAKKSFSELCSRASYGRDTIIVTKHGRPFVAIIGMAGLERALALEDQRAIEILERAIATSPGSTEVELHPET